VADALRCLWASVVGAAAHWPLVLHAAVGQDALQQVFQTYIPLSAAMKTCSCAYTAICWVFAAGVLVQK